MTMTEGLALTRRLPPLPTTLVNLGYRVAPLLDTYLFPVVQLGLRVWIANVFFSSGLSKLSDWSGTLLVFEYEYKVPILPVDTAAIFATFFELAMPVLLVFGLMTRAAALPLLVMAMIIQFVLGASNPAFDHIDHFYWMALLLVLISRGGGTLSLDFLLNRYLSSGEHHRRRKPH